MRNIKKLTIVLLLIAFSLSVYATGKKVELYWKTNTFNADKQEASFALDIGHQNKDELSLGQGGSNILGLAFDGSLVLGITDSGQNRAGQVFLFDYKTRKVLDVVRLNGEIFKGMHVSSKNLVITGTNEFVFGTWSDDNAGILVKAKYENNKIVLSKLFSFQGKYGAYVFANKAVNNKIYGIQYPENQLFEYDLTSNKYRIIKGTEFEKQDHGYVHLMHFKGYEAMTKSLFVDSKNRIYGTTFCGHLYEFDAVNDKFTNLDLVLPFVAGRKADNSVSSWVELTDGSLMGGTSTDGLLFSFSADRKVLTNLGMPIPNPSIQVLQLHKDMVYGFAGHQPEYSHFFSYSLTGKGFDDLGILRINNRMVNTRQMAYSVKAGVRINENLVIYGEDRNFPSLLYYTFE